MFRKQNHGILIACERVQSQAVRRHFLTGLYFIHNSGILSTINVCDRLDLGTWQLFSVGGHPWNGGSESFPYSRWRQDPPLPSLHSSAVWVMLELAQPTVAGKGRRQPWVLALSPRWAVSDFRHRGDSFEELAKPTPCFLCRMMKMLILGQLKANSEGLIQRICSEDNAINDPWTGPSLLIFEIP